MFYVFDKKTGNNILITDSFSHAREVAKQYHLNVTEGWRRRIVFTVDQKEEA